MPRFSHSLLRCIGLAAAAGALLLLLAQEVPSIRREGSYWIQTLRGRAPGEGVSRFSVISRGVVTVQGDEQTGFEYTLNVRVQAPNEAAAMKLAEGVQRRIWREGSTLHLRITEGSPGTLPHELEVRAPRSLLSTHVRTSGGRVNVSDLAGDVEAESGGGPISADRIGGGFVARTAGGAVEVGTVGGPVSCLTGGGDITVQQVGANATLDTGGGRITVTRAGGSLQATTGGGDINIEHAAGTVLARTRGGVIRVQEAAGMVSIDSAGGAIQVGAARGVRCQSAAGGIRLRGVGGPLSVSTSVGSIQAEFSLRLPLQDSFLNTGSGDVTVLIPSNMAVTVRAQNGSPGIQRRIISDFPEIRVRSSGQARAMTIAEGVLNGGGPLLRIAAADGTIFLRRLK